MSEQATAAIAFQPNEPFELHPVEIDEPRADEVLVSIKACGVCHTDKAARDQKLPLPLPIVVGHEAAGVVERVGSAVTKVVPGDRVLLLFGSCGSCPNCLVGKTMHCYDNPTYNFLGSRPDGTTTISYDGQPIHSHFIAQSSFATRAIVSHRSVMKIDDDIPFEFAGPFACGVITGAGTVLNVLKAEAGSSIAIFGAGAVGTSALLAARLAGCATIAVVDVNPGRLELARELGATHVINAEDQDPVEAIRAINGRGVNYAMDCTGSPGVLRQAFDSTMPLGVTAAVGSPPAGTEVGIDIINIIITGKTLVGAADGWAVPEIFIPRLFDLWRQGRFPIDRIFTNFPFEQINEAVDAASRGEVIKPVLVMP
jgi:aryl-alcohol dehydrogenase